MKIKNIKLTKLSVREIGLEKSEWDSREASIRKYGVLVPIICDKDGYVWDGVRRVFFARLIGLKTVPAIVIDKNKFSMEDLKELIAELQVS